MGTEILFGKSTYYYDNSADPGELARLLSYGVQQVDQGVIFFSEKRKILYANKYAFTMFYVRDNLTELGQTFSGWINKLGIEPHATTWCRVYAVNGKERLYKVRYRHLIDEDAKPLGHMYIIQNLSEIVDNGSGEQYRLTHDELTHLYNREGFTAATRQLLSNIEDDRRYLLLYSNIKDFKLINQLFGLEKGNDILLNIGEVLAQQVKDDDIYGRINGDHFALVMPKDRFEEKTFKKAVK